MSFLAKWVGKNKITGFVSEIDRFFQEWNQRHPKQSRSQRDEITKFQRIFYLRDHAVKDQDKNKVWEKF